MLAFVKSTLPVGFIPEILAVKFTTCLRPAVRVLAVIVASAGALFTVIAVAGELLRLLFASPL